MSAALAPLPPFKRSRVALRLTAAAALGRFELQRCARCGAVQYPPREACHRCLSIDLEWKLQSGTGRLIARTTLFHSHEPFFRQRLPWRLGLVSLDVGPTVLAHVHQSVTTVPAPVEVAVRLDKAGQAVLVARLPGGSIAMNEDPHIREMSCDPRGLSVFITDGTTSVGPPLVRELIEAGAKRIWVGHLPGETFNVPSPEVTAVLFDVRSDETIARAAQSFGASVDILINSGSTDAGVAASPREEMEVNYFGLLNLARHFAPAMQSPSGPVTRAWVNFLSLYALSNLPAQSTYSASMAAALSFSQGLRARCRPAGLRVMNVFSAPMSPDGLARAVVAAMRDGLEDVYPGDVAQEWLGRWLHSPKVLERELAE